MSDTASPSPIATPDILLPLEVITPTDRGGLLTVITALFLSFVLVFFLLRLCIRLKARGSWRHDDNYLSAATVFSVIQSAVVFDQVSRGFGRSADLIDPVDLAYIRKMHLLGRAAYASDVLYIFTLFLSKCVMVFLFLRLMPGRSHRIATWATVAASAAWAVVSILLITVNCDPLHPALRLTSGCADLFVRWEVIGILDIITEIAFFLSSIYLVARLQMSFKIKGIVILAFSFTDVLATSVVAASALRLHYLSLSIASANPTLTAVSAAVWTQIELDYSIMASTISCLGPFMSPSSREAWPVPGSGSGSGSGGSSGQQRATRGGAEYAPSSVGSASGARAKDKSAQTSVTEVPAPSPTHTPPMEMDETAHEPPTTERATSASHDSDGSSDRLSGESGHSRLMMIEKKVVWTLEHSRLDAGGCA
ncbi:hypothetical protein BJ546DRAFT_1076115 [Cryomyces antarcticus]|uniref:Rhodopsin domain-containing protein n=1 Tax=Cryomyces antarcticus TaxID=329879 RepID=A0ABR0M046_9PEZI|nr:hypothetical protein LTR39_000128 [Cryomyces antarcticus]KAK5257564.1 hypothetical protein LTR16_000249 [Cryomyces antarcticus]